MSALSNFARNNIIDFLFRGQTFAPSATFYIALCTATPVASNTGATITEVSGGNYARQSIASSLTTWYSTQGDTSASTGTTGTTGNIAAINWNAVTWTASVTAVAICDAATNGNLLMFGALTSGKSVSSGDNVSFASNALQPSFT